MANPSGAEGGAVVTTVINVVNIAPAVYTINDAGQGTYSGQVTYVHADGTQAVVQSANPINLGTPGDPVYAVLYATGMRHGSSVTATVNGTPVPVGFFGPSRVIQVSTRPTSAR